jgi:hypothetical protein
LARFLAFLFLFFRWRSFGEVLFGVIPFERSEFRVAQKRLSRILGKNTHSCQNNHAVARPHFISHFAIGGYGA